MPHPCSAPASAAIIATLLVLVLVLGPASRPALAQVGAPGAQTGVVSGVVTDSTGGVLPGVTVTLTVSAADRRTSTTHEGRYRFDGVPAGTHRLSVSAINFASVRRPAVVVAAGQTVVEDVVLQLSLSADVVVTGTRSFRNLADLPNPEENLVGVAAAASEGAVTARQIAARPISRPGEVLESIPGVIVSQHSGEGKANQYYLRGFNLDHGTDFSTTVAGIPVNMPTHAHGQGYTDVNFVIPELVSGIQFRKGPYYAEDGDFSAAGSASIRYVNALDRPIASGSYGEHGWQRLLLAGSRRAAGGDLLGAVEINRQDGPWVRPDDYGRTNAVLRYSRGGAQSGFSVTGLLHRAEWDATDQTPARAVASGLITRFGSIDTTDGGRTNRVAVVAEGQRARGAGLTRVSAYASRYALNLFSNFTYFLDDPVRGDQFEQADRRWQFGGRVVHRRLGELAGRAAEHAVGMQARHDDIPLVGLFHTQARVRLETVRQDDVRQSSVGVFGESLVHWTPWLRTTAGLRLDGYRFAVDAGDPVNAGTATDAIVSPKGAVILGPWSGTEFYLNGGLGFHSNDARGVTIARDPATGDPADPVTPLVRARGAEVGFRTVAIPRVQTTLALWRVSLASELLFVGDAGTTEGGRPSERWGLESTTYVRIADWLQADMDLAWSRAQFADDDQAGTRIPGAPELVAGAGLTVEDVRGAFGSVRLRYFGPRPLVEDDSIRSEATSLINAQVGYHLTSRLRVLVDALNLMDAEASDIDYFYASRLPGEPADGVEDVHTHPTLPRSIRLRLAWQF